MDKLMVRLNEIIDEIEDELVDIKGQIESVISDIDSALKSDDAEELINALEQAKYQLEDIIREI
ncbi:hypothetical protein [Anoxybacillus ayderensis]|uniref:hypothetical protein n=1 Tax=Anoxybacillus ayderensis TaxID=265546 RepID=UPI002E23ACE0|nr:hypothetical protein [Anoxybacillus ayderensis]